MRKGRGPNFVLNLELLSLFAYRYKVNVSCRNVSHYACDLVSPNSSKPCTFRRRSSSYISVYVSPPGFKFHKHSVFESFVMSADSAKVNSARYFIS